MKGKLSLKVYRINKKIGETPLEALTKFISLKKLPKDWKFTYAGRLDPMARGLLLVLANATQSQREKYLGLGKIYEAEVLFGFASDTGDLLGLATKQKNIQIHKRTQKEFKEAIESFVPQANLYIPAFSSVLVKGKPSFFWAKLGKKLPQVKRLMEFKSIKILKKRTLTEKQILSYLEKNLVKVSGDFRQEDILANWKKLLGNSREQYILLKIRVHSGSGAYIRSLAQEWGRKLGQKSLLFSLKRTKIGRFELS
jgi:tRNA pseudouridine(55) synthase